ncbi:MAG TPA: DUF6379 domain-containing protein [Patescibacteria group bacterium]|nr:DUF6379 domain-containing protein [Patescibacteria group bacterium]
MFDEQIINGELLYPEPGGAPGVRLRIRLPWYRSLPLSCIERVEVTIDGEPVNRAEVSLTLDGLNHTLDEAAGLHDVWWFVLDTADLHIRRNKPLSPGDHPVTVTLGCRIPYSATDFVFRQVARCEKTLTLVGRDW